MTRTVGIEIQSFEKLIEKSMQGMERYLRDWLYGTMKNIEKFRELIL